MEVVHIFLTIIEQEPLGIWLYETRVNAVAVTPETVIN